MIAMVKALANQKPRSPPCPRTRRHCRPNEDPDYTPFMLGNGSLYSKPQDSNTRGWSRRVGCAGGVNGPDDLGIHGRG